MFRVLAVGGSPARPTMTQTLLNEAADTRVSMVETAGSARVVLEGEEFDVAVVETADAKLAIPMIEAILGVNPLLPVVVVTDAETGAPKLFDLGAQDHLCREGLTQPALLASLRHAIVRRAAAARAVTDQRARGDAGGSTRPMLPEVLLASTPDEPPAGLLSTLAALLQQEDPASITIDRLRMDTGLPADQLRRAKRPIGNVMLFLIKRDLDAEAELVQMVFTNASGQATSLADAMLVTVKTFAGFWRQSPASIRLATDFTGLDDRLRDLRFDHLQLLSDTAAAYLADHVHEVVHRDPKRAIDVAVDQLLALLDHQRLLGALHPADGTPEEVIAEFAGQMTTFLRGPEGHAAAAPAHPTAAPEPVVVEAPPAPEPAVVEAPPAPEPVVVAATPEPEPVVEAPPAPEPVVVEAPPAPEPVVVEAPPAPEPVVVEAPPAPEPVVVEAPPAPEPVAASVAAPSPLSEDARVAAALARMHTHEQAISATGDAPTGSDSAAARPLASRAPGRPVPTDDPFVTAKPAAAAPKKQRPTPRPTQVAEPVAAAAAVPEPQPKAEKTSLFGRKAPVSTEGAPTFDMARTVIEIVGPPDSTGAGASHVFSKIPPSGAPTSPGDPGTFDVSRTVIDRATPAAAAG